MLKSFSGINFQDVYKTALHELMTDGVASSPRGMETKEFVPAVFQIENPLSRMLTLKTRKANPFYGMIETLWYMNGDNKVAPLANYNKNIVNFSDDGETMRGAYGARLVRERNNFDKSQFGLIYDKLRKDPGSRQAVAVIFDPWRDYEDTKDVPCTVTFIFTIREDKLNMTAVMRSNDIVWGATYDVFAFTMFQEFLARKLGVGLGTYTHMANSFHIYSNHYDMAKEMIFDNSPVMYMPEMPVTSWKLLNDLYDFEEEIRTCDGFSNDVITRALEFGEYWGRWALMIILHKALRLKDAAIGQKVWGNLIDPYKELTVSKMETLI